MLGPASHAQEEEKMEKNASLEVIIPSKDLLKADSPSKAKITTDYQKKKEPQIQPK